MKVEIQQLASVPLPDGWVRQYPEKLHSVIPDNIAETFDTSTFCYGAYFTSNSVVLVCPKLLNTKAVLSFFEFYVDTIKASYQLKEHRYFDELVFVGDCPNELEIRSEGASYRYQREETAIFDGQNTVVTVSKNNDLQWIRDFAHYYVHNHKAEALLLFDNASDRYAVDDIVETLAPVGLKQLKIVSVPCPYGPMLTNRSTQLMFLQRSLLHLARRVDLASARAVLSVDIDELVSVGKQTIFDAAVNSVFGFVRIPGEWRYRQSSADNRHQHHIIKPLTHAACPPKFCYQPSSLLLKKVLFDVHGLEVQRDIVRKILHIACTSLHYRFWHLAGLTTTWKGVRSGVVEQGDVDEKLESIFADTFRENKPMSSFSRRSARAETHVK